MGHAWNLLKNEGQISAMSSILLTSYIMVSSIRRSWTFGFQLRNSFSQWRRVALHGLQVKDWNMPARWMVQCATHRLVCYN